MPNWIKGTLKVRGPYEAVKKFFCEGAILYQTKVNDNGLDYEIVPKEKWLVVEELDDSTELNILDEPHIDGTRRAFLDKQTVYIESEEKGQGYACAEISQAWKFCEENWVKLSQKYGVDFRLYGFESGCQFCQELEVIGGKITFNNEIIYDDWDWECPFPRLGG